MRRSIASGLLLAMLGSAGAAQAQAPLRCADITDPVTRLACYDRLNRSSGPPAATAPSEAVTTPPPAAPADRRAVAPRDRAFDPASQQVPFQSLGEVLPPLRRVGSVPIAEPGSNVPPLTLSVPSLRAIPGEHWELGLVLANNSPYTMDVRVQCAFRNGTRAVADITVLMRAVRPGDQVATEVVGPPVTTFVDNAPCNAPMPLP